MQKSIELILKIDQINDSSLIKKIVAKKCGLAIEQISDIEYLKRSLDCRQSTPKYKLIVNVYTEGEKSLPVKNVFPDRLGSHTAIVIGAGPAGYFAALELIAAGIKPIVLERGKDVSGRRKDLKTIMQLGVVNPDSNYCFGEGGAGTFSDGKLYTRSNKRGDIRKVLQTFVAYGADPDILVDAQAHIGSDKLPQIVAAMRNSILEHGGEVHFETKVTGFLQHENSVSGVKCENGEEYFGDCTILATGHSASDIYYMFAENKFAIKAKPFAVGFRVEHSQEWLNKLQYGEKFYKQLPPATYKLVARGVGDRGVFSFCMCPGGIIIPASTAENQLVVNGMSVSKRNSKFANAGIVTSVGDEDFFEFAEYGELAGLKLRESLESSFYLGNPENFQSAPAQRTIDFLNGKISKSLIESSYIPGLECVDLNKLFPRKVAESLRIGLGQFNKRMKGFVGENSLVIGLESRTSTPVRIPRDAETMEHIELKNLYPCGEGAGYSGGIVSSALDGINVARTIAKKIQN